MVVGFGVPEARFELSLHVRPIRPAFARTSPVRPATIPNAIPNGYHPQMRNIDRLTVIEIVAGFLLGFVLVMIWGDDVGHWLIYHSPLNR